MERWLSKITLAQTFYGHFYIEHNRGHHVRVSPRRIPPRRGSVRRSGSSCRAACGGVPGRHGTWRRRGSAGSARARGTGICNDVLNAWLMSVVFWGVLIAMFGPALIPFVIVSGGLRLRDPGVGQLPRALRAAAAEELQRPIRALHPAAQLELRSSGDQPVPLPPAAAQRSPRQPDAALPDAAQHGRRAGAAQRLRHADRLTYFPWLWRKMMDHRVLEHYNGDITRVNIDPRRREKILARYGDERLREEHWVGRERRHERLPVPGLRLHLRRGERCRAGRIPGRHRLERHPRRLVLPRLRGAREGRLRTDGGASECWR